jgi:hypothetical protein
MDLLTHPCDGWRHNPFVIGACVRQLDSIVLAWARGLETSDPLSLILSFCLKLIDIRSSRITAGQRDNVYLEWFVREAERIRRSLDRAVSSMTLLSVSTVEHEWMWRIPQLSPLCSCDCWVIRRRRRQCRSANVCPYDSLSVMFTRTRNNVTREWMTILFHFPLHRFSPRWRSIVSLSLVHCHTC